MVFKQCEDKDDALKLGLVYFVKGVLIGAKRNEDEEEQAWGSKRRQRSGCGCKGFSYAFSGTICWFD
ncbi:hypothetical protein D8674_037627 [Pyrus ussuriensis x Pyrus communis]|uniref:Uncharacterized protein n=1 Tax=Pyrus ussuriensis x Pyrus communis TaxID=2448454 RepID=A0A5N5H383_9ROSA|nr:hypothetical protein D8674_037627 [Pyrus ussuriensis x Pyrus communis]